VANLTTSTAGNFRPFEFHSANPFQRSSCGLPTVLFGLSQGIGSYIKIIIITTKLYPLVFIFSYKYHSDSTLQNTFHTH